MKPDSPAAMASPVRDVIVFVGVGVGITMLFAIPGFDIAVTRIFYERNALEHWPWAAHVPWSVLYRMAPWVTTSLILIGLIALVVGWVYRCDAWRRQGVFVLLSVILGPGLLINTVFKDHWDRPRPRDIIEFGGPLHYAPAPLWGEGGKSFPCGHCSVGYLYGLGWWIWRGRRPNWARASLAVGLLAGTALGLGRMAAGGHFLSDVVWSAFLALGIAHALYYHVLQVPQHELGVTSASPAGAEHPRSQRVLVILAALGGIIVLLALFATPHGMRLTTEIPLETLTRAPKVFEVTARVANVEIILADSPVERVSVTGELHGFGLPTSRLRADVQFDAAPVPRLRFLIEQLGWFTDLDAHAVIRVPRGELEQVVVRLDRGNIHLTDATQAHVVNSGRVRLDLRTARGQVRVTDR